MYSVSRAECAIH